MPVNLHPLDQAVTVKACPNNRRGRRTPYWIVHELFCNAIFSNYLDIAKEAAKRIPTLMYVAEHWADIAESWYNKQCPETPTYVMGGHLMAYEYPDEFNTRLDQFLDSLDK